MITELREGIPMEIYRLNDGLSKHEFDNFMKSPAEYKFRKKQPWKPSREAVLGTLIHSFVLEDRVDFAVGPDVDRRTKAGKEEWVLFCENNIGKEIITNEEYLRICGASMSAKVLLQDVKIDHIEASMFWERSGVQCKGRPDIIGRINDKPVILDLKTTSDFYSFDRKFWSFGYDVQAAWYAYGLKQIWGTDVDFWFLVADTEQPHFAQFVLLGSDAMEAAQEKIEDHIDHFAECEKKDFWPGPLKHRILGLRQWQSL
jgi:hypothetical protein